MSQRPGERLEIAIIGSGISGLSAAWLLSTRHNVTIYEKARRLGGHANTIDVQDRGKSVPVDMGFIVFNTETYPNLTALLRVLDVATQPSDMSFAVSMGGGRLEYAGTDLIGMFAQRRNLFRPRYWSMLRDLVRFYEQASRDAATPGALAGSLGDYLAAGAYGEAFVRDHLLPMAAAIWSTPCGDMLAHPASAFLRFCHNHGLLRLTGRPIWRTVTGGSRAYVEKISRPLMQRVRLGTGVRSILRGPSGVTVVDDKGERSNFDHVVIATHSDQALSMLADPSDAERNILGPLRYAGNEAVMHTDAALMPRRRRAWCSWNYLGDGLDPSMCVTYWMNRLQGFETEAPTFVTLNPRQEPDRRTVIHREQYEHPQFDAAALDSQRRLWSLQGVRNTWYCGAYFGAGFHEDGLQAGLAVAEALGGVRRPWSVAEESGRIRIGRHPAVIAA